MKENEQKELYFYLGVFVYVHLFMGPKERGSREGRRTNILLTQMKQYAVRPADVYGLAESHSGNASVGGQFQRGTALLTNANTPSSYCLYLSQNHSFPVCILVTVTITSFKNSLPYII